MSNSQVSVKIFQEITIGTQHNNIMQGGCVRPPFERIPLPPPIFLDPPRCGEPPIFRIPPGEIPRCPFPNPPLPQGKEANVYRNGDGKIVLDAGSGDDKINVTRTKGGGVCVEVNGEKYHFTAAQARNLEIRGGSGDDQITVDKKVRNGLTIRGGSGDDTIRGGSGNDRIYGDSGDDTIYGGRGSDEIYGGSGDDTIHGGRGNDYIQGGSGDDNLFGGRGNDLIFGGRGNDALNGGRGSDLTIQDDFFFSRFMNNLRRI